MSQKKRVVSALIIALLTLTILSGCSKTDDKPVATGNKDVVKASNKGKALALDLPGSKLEWVGKKVTGQHNGTVEITKGQVFVDEDNITGGSFEIDFNSIKVVDITDAESNGKLVNHLKSDDFFSAMNHPVGKFEITSVTPTSNGENNYNLGGNLTIKGTTNSIEFPAKINLEENKLTAKADFKIDRTLWDIKFRSGKFYENLGDKLISDDILLVLNISTN